MPKTIQIIDGGTSGIFTYLGCIRKELIMAFSYTNSKGKTYFLHHKTTLLKSGREQTIYFFAKEVRDEGSLNAVPEAYEVSESKNGLPVLRKKK